MLALAAGCAPRAHVERLIPSALQRTSSVAVVHPGGHAFSFDPDVLQREIGDAFRQAGFERVHLLGASERRDADLTALVESELMARPLEDDGDFGTRGPLGRASFAGERVRVVLQILDRSGAIVYRATRIDGLSSALTEIKVAGALLRPLQE